MVGFSTMDASKTMRIGVGVIVRILQKNCDIWKKTIKALPVDLIPHITQT